MGRSVWIGIALALLLVVGAGLRVWNINWDRFQHVHPDERYIVWVADSLSLPSDLATALDPLRSTINPFRWPPGHGNEAGKPRSYPYGHFPLYLLVIVAHAGQAAGEWFGETTLAFPPAFQPLHTVGRHLAEYNYLALVGRAISAACDLGVLLLVYVLARGIYGRGAGLLAAAAYTFAVLPIQLSHFYAVDVVLTFCVMATLAAAVRWAERGGWGAALAAGIFFGLAVGSKFSAVLLVLPLVAAAVTQAGGLRPTAQAGGLRYVIVVPVVAAAVFALTNPFALIEFQAYASNILAQNAMVSGLMDAPYTRQYIGTWPYWYFIHQLSRWGTGWPLGVVAWAGLIWATARFGLQRTGRAEVVLLAWALPYFALTGAFHAKFLRYMAPLLPVLLIFGAGAAMAARRWLIGRWARRGRLAWAAAAAVVLATTVGWALAFTGVYRQEHPWLQASRWIFANIPDGSKLLTEHWDDALPLLMDEIPDRPAPRTYARVELPLWDPDTRAKLDRLADELSSADYLILASNRLSAPIARLRERYPMTSAYYRLLFAGELGYTPVAEFTAYPRLCGIVIRDDRADESFTVYDHPRAVIFQNTGRLSAALLRARLGRYLPQRQGGRGGREDEAEVKAEAEKGDLPQTAGGARGREGIDIKRSDARCTNGSERRQTSPVLRLQGVCDPRLTVQDDACAPTTPVADRLEAVSPTTPVADRLEAVPKLSLMPMGREVDVSRPPGHAREQRQPPAPDAPLTLAQPVDTLPVVADFRWNVAASEHPFLAVLLWWLAIAGMGWAAWPLLFPLVRGLPDRGYGLARMAGWLLIGWVHWMAVSLGLWQNRLAPIALVYGALVAAGLLAYRTQRAAFGRFWDAHRRGLLAEETVFGAAYLAFVVIRLLNPDLWQPWNGGEKFMESAFLNAILRSAHFPPYDPYFAGGTLNYYYFGLYLVSLPIKLTGIAPEVAFNLAVPALFALTALGLFSVGRALGTADRRWPTAAAGGLAVLVALLMGNLDALRQLTTWLRGLLAGQLPPGFDYWASSRVIPETINEFPFWTFLFADLHPHLIAMPFGMLVVGLAANRVIAAGSTFFTSPPSPPLRGEGREDESPPSLPGEGLGSKSPPSLPGEGIGNESPPSLPGEGIGNESPPSLAGEGIGNESPPSLAGKGAGGLGNAPLAAGSSFLLLLALGALGAINTWDLPTYFLLIAAAFLIGGWRAGRWRGMATAAAAAAVAGGAAVVAYWPFYAHYQSQVGHGEGFLPARYLGWVRAASPLAAWFTVWGILWLLSLWTLIGLWLAARRDRPAADPAEVAEETGRPRFRGALAAALGLIAVLLILIALDRPTAALMALPLGLALPLVFRRRSAPADNFVALLLALGAAVVMGTELVYLRDFLEGGDWYRMNTLFKFSVPAWLFLGLGCGALLPRLWPAGFAGRSVGGSIWRAAPASLIAAGLLFLPLGIPARVQDRFPERRPPIGTLNGMDYMAAGVFYWPDAEHAIDLSYDYLAIRWLLDHVAGTPIVAEAPAGPYLVAGQAVTADYYRAGGLRVASFTGFPTLVGQHQYEQRPADQVALRTRLGQELFQTTDIARARDLLSELRVGLVYIGPLERLLFHPDALRKFDVLVELGELEIVYRNAQTMIYRVGTR